MCCWCEIRWLEFVDVVRSEFYCRYKCWILVGVCIFESKNVLFGQE